LFEAEERLADSERMHQHRQALNCHILMVEVIPKKKKKEMHVGELDLAC